MSWKSIWFRFPPHWGSGFFSKISSERRRNWRIQSGSFFIHEISSTISLFKPFLALNTNFSASWKPYFSKYVEPDAPKSNCCFCSSFDMTTPIQILDFKLLHLNNQKSEI